jgi:VWFA-related protein
MISTIKHTAIILGSIIFSSAAAFAQTPTPAATPPIPEEDQVVKVDSRLVVVPVSVTNAAGEPVLGLTDKDFRVAEEGKAQVIDHVGNAENVPLEIVLLFDVSASTDTMFKFEQETAAKFLREVMRSDDRATIFSVGQKPTLIQTRDTAEKSIASIM